MKIYTRAGDDGSTGLYGGSRVSKAEPRIDCVGTVDELNAMIGWAAVACLEAESAERGERILPRLRVIQHELFNLGARLATPAAQRGENAGARLPMLGADAVSRLEREIDAAEAELPPLRNFILPGGSELAARLHLARTACRAAERALVGLNQGSEPVEPVMLQYLNRLSDWLFVAARRANRRGGVEDVAWVSARSSPGTEPDQRAESSRS